MVQALRRVIPVDLVVVEALDLSPGVVNGYDLMTACHRRALHDAQDAGGAVMFLSADFVFSERSFAAVVRRHDEGYRAVVNTGLRLAKEGFLKAISSVPLDTLSSRELVRLALPHLHQHERDMFRDARPSMAKPVAVYWRVGENGLLARCFHLHPLMVDPMVRTEMEGTADGRYLSEACPDFSRIHRVIDSDEVQMFELTPAKAIRLRRIKEGLSALRAARRALECDRLQIRYWQSSSICIHAEEVDDRWHAVETEAEGFAARVLRARPAAQIVTACRQQVRHWGPLHREKLRRRVGRRWLRLHKRVARETRIAWDRARKVVKRTVRLKGTR